MQDPLRYTASILGMIIGDDSGSRYYWALTEPALAEIASMQCDSMDGTGVYYSYLCCDPNKADAVLDTVKNLFSEIERDGVSQDEMETAKNKTLSALTIKCEQPMGRLVSLGFNWVYNNEYKSVLQDVEDVKRVTLDDLSLLIRKLAPGKFTMLSLGPRSE